MHLAVETEPLIQTPHHRVHDQRPVLPNLLIYFYFPVYGAVMVPKGAPLWRHGSEMVPNA